MVDMGGGGYWGQKDIMFGKRGVGCVSPDHWWH